MAAVFIVRSEATDEASFAEIRALSRFGMAMAAIIRMIATTIKSSISEKPFCVFRISSFLRQRFELVLSLPFVVFFFLGRPIHRTQCAFGPSENLLRISRLQPVETDTYLWLSSGRIQCT